MENFFSYSFKFIYEGITGEKGYFDTKVVYVAEKYNGLLNKKISY